MKIKICPVMSKISKETNEVYQYLHEIECMDRCRWYSILYKGTEQERVVCLGANGS